MQFFQEANCQENLFAINSVRPSLRRKSKFYWCGNHTDLCGKFPEFSENSKLIFVLFRPHAKAQMSGLWSHV